MIASILIVALTRTASIGIYSISKMVTGVSAMRLIQDGKLGLDQPVAELIPEWKSLRLAVDAEKSLESRPARTTMTMRHLLTHTSGLAHWIPAAGSGLLADLPRWTPENRPLIYRAKPATMNAATETS